MLTASLMICILIFINALYVASEFAAVGVRRTQIEQMATEGNLFARLLHPVISQTGRLDTYVAACQIGITLSSLVLGAYGQITVAVWLAGELEARGVFQAAGALPAASLATLLGLTVIQVVFGELVPKSVAIRYPARVALATVVPMKWSLVAFRPLVWLLNGSANVILAVFRVSPSNRRHIHLAEEIDLLVEDSHEGGLLDDSERARLHNVFRLSSKRVKEIMVPRTRVFAVDIATPADELKDLAAKSAYTRIPVYHEHLDEVRGVIHIKDLLALSLEPDECWDIERVLRPVPIVLENQPVKALLNDLRDRHFQMALVVDEYGGTSGIVTLEDVLEEVVGDIPDEYPKELVEGILPVGDGRLRVPGACSISDLADYLDIALEYPDASTIGGLVMGLLGRMPRPGDTVSLSGVGFEVESVANDSVWWALVTPPVEKEEEKDDV